ncbi:MAG TPA: phosphatidylserine decarboxylase family protein, partial [Bacteroidetes bacterium]|nr:phosphatidylserine decarboxylase family protein [Bacteroidota bacterium]
VAGKRFGMIKFGSRVDIYVPKNAEIKVTMNQKTVAGETVVAVIQ